MSAFIDRRQFIAILFSCSAFLQAAIAQSKNEKSLPEANAHFYCLDLRTGQIFLPKDGVVDYGQPGSIMKIVATAAILEENRPAATRLVDCRGAMTVDGQTYICRHAHGRISLVEALGQSCNVFFAHAGNEISQECFLHYLQKFGLGQTIVSPMLNKPKSISANISLILGIADGFTVSATQILQLVASIANRGQRSLLHCHNKTEQKIIMPELYLAEHTWNILQTGMHIACQRGTAKNLDPQNKLHIAAKTGTTIHGHTFQSWLAGYFPYESPRYVFCLRAPVGTSYDAAVPLANQYLLARSWS